MAHLQPMTSRNSSGVRIRQRARNAGRFVGDSYGERLRVIKARAEMHGGNNSPRPIQIRWTLRYHLTEDWAVVQQASAKKEGKDQDEDPGAATQCGEAIEKKEDGEKAEGDEEAPEDDTRDAGAETFSLLVAAATDPLAPGRLRTGRFGRMCAFSNEVMGQKTEGWMLELLGVFNILVDMISSPVHLQEECDLLAINLITKSSNIDFEKFKPVMLAALRSLLPKQWSTLHENAWEWLWMTVARNLNESTMKVRAFKPYNGRLFDSLTEECPGDVSQSRLRYIADRVLQSSYDLFHKNKDESGRTLEETLDELSALGLRHVGYGIPIELFGPFVEVCVTVMHPLIQEFPNDIDAGIATKPFAVHQGQ
eukprot:Skav203477  [mRNA]  locus=scaffold921:163503:175914:+ [translate_table: standard]